MYVEISPRQSGKTTRLIQAASDYLRHNPTHNIAVVSVNRKFLNDIKRKLMQSNVNIERIKFLSSIFPNLLGQFIEPDYWFFDEFGYINIEYLLNPRTRTIFRNGYYCTTPTLRPNTTSYIVDYCRGNNIEIHWNNPWTESHIMEQNTIGWDDYTREVVLGDWVRFMESKGLFNGIKINLIRKEIKKHRFTSW